MIVLSIKGYRLLLLAGPYKILKFYLPDGDHQIDLPKVLGVS